MRSRIRCASRFRTTGTSKPRFGRAYRFFVDRGEIAFDGRGRYRKLRATVERSVRVDFREAAAYASASQVARVAIETWVARNVACWRCSAPLLPLPANTRLKDVVCQAGTHDVQVKAAAHVIGDRLVGAAFGPMAQALEEGSLPDYLLVSYDRPRSVVMLAEFIDGASIVRDRVIARTPLGENARRAGWVGATLDVHGLERRVVVGPSFTPEVASWAP
jgi:hypothetical protein